jgi:gliding motility-associated-like protein
VSGETSLNPIVNAAGTYTLTVTNDDNDCSISDTAVVSQNMTQPEAHIEASGTVLTCEVSSITLTAVVDAVQGEPSYRWGLSINAPTTASLEVTEPGTYTIYVIDSENGCVTSEEIEITQDIVQPEIHIEAGGTELTCETTSVTLTAIVDAIQGEPSYRWGLSINAPTTSSIEVSEPGTYTVYITDSATGCITSEDIEISQVIVQPVAHIEASGTNLTCETTSITLTAVVDNIQGNPGYRWGLSINAPTTASIEVAEPGIYTVYIMDSENGCVTSEEIEITQETSQIEAVIKGNAELNCNVTAIVLDAGSSTGQGVLSYQWSTGATTSSIEVSTPGEYSVTVTDADNGCSDTMMVEVMQDVTAPEAIITGNAELNCNVTAILLDASGSTGQGELSYAWSTGATTSTIEVSTPGEYSVMVTDADNGCTDTTLVEVMQDTTEIVAVIEGILNLNCANGTSVLDAGNSTGQGELSFLWNTGATTSSIEVNTPGVYTVTVTDADNGCSNTAQVTVTDTAVDLVVDITGATELTCLVQQVELTANVEGNIDGVTYLWSTGATTASIMATAPGDYTVTVSVGNNGCEGSDTITITENVSTVEAAIVGDRTLDCNMTSIILDASSSTATGEVTYLWSTGATTPVIEVNEAGSYVVTVTDITNGCADATSFEVVEDFTPETITGSFIDLCIEDLLLDLTSLLPADYVSGGTWVDDYNSGGLSGSMFDPSQVNLENFTFTYTEPGDCGRIINVGVNVNDDCVVLPCTTEGEIEISKVVTPNSDGINDYFEVSDVTSCGYTARVQILNRWGQVVYYADNYMNDWDGHHNNSGLTVKSGSTLPSGTYYYVVEIDGSGYAPRTGYIYLGTR